MRSIKSVASAIFASDWNRHSSNPAAVIIGLLVVWIIVSIPVWIAQRFITRKGEV